MQEKHTWLRKLQKSFPVTLSGDDPTLKTVYLSLPEFFFFWASRASSIPTLKTAITTHPRRRTTVCMIAVSVSPPPSPVRVSYIQNLLRRAISSFPTIHPYNDKLIQLQKARAKNHHQQRHPTRKPPSLSSQPFISARR